jgi:hypothetical protein
MKRAVLACFMLALLITSPAAIKAQTIPSQTSKEEQKKAREEIERRTLLLLDEIVAETQLLKLAENRSIIQASAADLLWPRDEKRARTLFRDALTAIGEALNNLNQIGSSQRDQYWMVAQLRHQLLRTVARRDPQLALDLIQLTRPSSIEGMPEGYGMREQELMLEQSIAAEVVANDPKRALQMAQESLSKGVSYGVLTLLHKLHRKDPEAAKSFMGDVIKKLQTENLTRNHSASFVAQELLRQLLRPKENSSAQEANQNATITKTLSFDEQTKRELAEIVVRAALEGPAPSMAVMAFQNLLPELEKLVPDRALQLRQRFAEAKKLIDPEARKWMEFEPLLRDGTPQAMIDAAPKAPADMRRSLYSTAVWKLLQSGDAERARQIINDNMSGQERDQFLAHIDQRLIARALEQGKLDEAKQLLSRIRSKNNRATQIALLAIALTAKGERKLAMELLDETKTLINRQPDNQNEINAVLVVARAYAGLESPRAFELIEPLVEEANDMISAAALLDKFGQGQGMFRKSEMLLSPGFMATNTMFAQYGKELGTLARADFNRTKALADRFQRQEVRLMARLLIVQGVLSDRLGVGSGDAIQGDGFGYEGTLGSFVVEY